MRLYDSNEVTAIGYMANWVREQRHGDITYFVRNQRDIIKKVTVYRGKIKEIEARYEELQAGWREGRYDVTERNLMIDGLLKRFLVQCDEA